MKEKQKTYRQLVNEFKKNKSEKSFKALYEKIKPGLWRYIFNIVKDHDVADDITSSTLTTVYLKIDMYDESYQITTWTYKIAYNECVGWLRFKNRYVGISVFNDNGVEVNSEGTITNTAELNYSEFLDTEEYHYEEDQKLIQQHQLVYDAIHALPELYRPYMIERFINGKSYNDIYEIMLSVEDDINLQTVKNRIFRGRRLIREQMKKNHLFIEYTN